MRRIFRFLPGNLLAGILAGLVLAGPALIHAQTLQFPSDRLSIVSGDREHVIQVEVARTPAQLSQGLMFRRKMAKDAGMVFIFPKTEIIVMWMKNTLIPLDMLFVGADGRIRHIHERAVPKSLARISSGEPALVVIELNGGTAARLGLKKNDLVRFAPLGTNQ